MRVMRIASLLVTSLAFLLVIGPFVSAQEGKICLVYITGIGCPHCAVSDPIVLQELPNEHSNLVVIEYEIYQQRDNSPLLMLYNDKYNTGLGIPLLIFDESFSIIGDSPIVNNIRQVIENLEGGNDCLLLDGYISFEDLDLDKLQGFPNIWANNRILIKIGKGEESGETKNLMKELLFSEDLCEKIQENELKEINPEVVHISGKNVKFEKAVELGTNWILQYNSGDMVPCEESVEESTNYIFIAIPIIIAVILIGAFGIKKVR